MERESFVFYRSFYKAIMKLDDKDLAQAIRAICAYALDGELIECEGISEIIFDMAKPQIDANNNRFVNGQKGGRPKKTIGFENENHRFSEKKPNVNVNDNENVNVNENVNDKGINYQLIADMYNEICISFPKLTKLSDNRKKAIKARLKTYSIEDLKRAFELAEQSDFLKGANNRNWSANFDWLMNDTNLAKVLDGNYQNKKAKTIEMDSNLREFINKNQVVDFGI